MAFNWKKIVEITIVTVGTAFLITSIVGKKKQGESRYENDPDQKNPLEGKKVVFVENTEESENADGMCGHLEAIARVIIKRAFMRNMLNVEWMLYFLLVDL